MACQMFTIFQSILARKAKTKRPVYVPPAAAAAAVRDLLDPFGTRQIGNLLTCSYAKQRVLRATQATKQPRNQ